MRSVLASVNAPRTWPNNSLSKMPSGKPPVFTATSGRDARLDSAYSVRATTSFPLPCSPVISTFASEGPTLEIRRRTGCIASESAINVGRFSARSSRFSASNFCPRRNALPSSICVRSTESSRAFSQGFWIKSRAPRRIASTASSTLPQAVITITGSVLSIA